MNRADEFARALGRKVKGRLLIKEPLWRHTTWRIGGPADVMLLPADISDIPVAVELAREMGYPVTVLGNGSNVLVADAGIRGLVIKTGGCLTGCKVEGTRAIAEAGALLPRLLRITARAGLGGLEGLAGIPGTVGGAVVGNAGARGTEMGNLVYSLMVLDGSGQIRNLQGREISFGYRSSDLEGIVIKVALELYPEDPVAVSQKIRQNLSLRRQTQPLGEKCAGSVFKNPPGRAAGYLIEKIGAKGWRRGGAVVSEKHANFIINTGGATAEDVLELMAEIRHKVLEAFGVLLEPEVKILGP